MRHLDIVLDSLFTKQRWVLHVLFWLAVLIWYVIFFGRENSNYVQTSFFVGLLMPVTIATSYFLNYYLVPRFLLKEKYGFFLLYFIYTLIGSLFLEMVISFLTFIVVAELKIRNMSPASVDLFFLLTSLLTVVFLGVAIKLLLHWRKSKEDYQTLLREKVEEELKFLKAQLNPHFLFNTLNNLYYLTTQKSEQAPRAILQLSEILDYVLYTCKADVVPLVKEWQQAQNYIALKSLHYEDRLDVESKISGNMEQHSIAPMILLNLIENAFKHGAMKVSGRSWIKVGIHCNEDNICISMRNNCKYETGGNGIGLENLRNQLNLLYRENHALRINADPEGEFSIALTLNHRK